jgi:hypothetical protein
MAHPSRDRPKFAQPANAHCDEDRQKQLFDDIHRNAPPPKPKANRRRAD